MSSRASSNRWYRVLLMVLVAAGLAWPAAAQKCWSALGSTAVIDPDSISVAKQGGLNLGVHSTAPLPTTVVARYTLSGIQDDTGSSPNGKILLVHFVDNGLDAQVKVLFKQLSTFTQASTELKAFDSNDYLPSANPQIVAFPLPCAYGGGFFSLDYSYFIVAEITKSGSGGNPLLQLVQVCERAGLPYPLGC